MKALILVLLFASFTGFAQDGEPSYRFKLGTVEYTIHISQNAEDAKIDTTYYNLYRVGKAKMIGKHIKEITNISTKEILGESYYNVGHDKIIFYYSTKEEGAIAHIYSQNKKGLMDYKSEEVKIPPPEQIRVDYYNENPIVERMVPTIALYEPIDQVDEIAEYPGGINKLRQFIAANIIFPDLAIEYDVSGTVVATFIVEKDGTISNIEIVKKLGYGCDEEVIRVLKKAEKWKPAQLNGEAVRYSYRLPVAFAPMN